MKKLIINKCMELVTTYNKDLSQRDIDKIKYGLEGLYLTITKLIFNYNCFNNIRYMERNVTININI